jgi:hypothetical protein
MIEICPKGGGRREVERQNHIHRGRGMLTRVLCVCVCVSDLFVCGECVNDDAARGKKSKFSGKSKTAI